MIPWRRDIENMPKDGTRVLAWVKQCETESVVIPEVIYRHIDYRSEWDERDEYTERWQWRGAECDGETASWWYSDVLYCSDGEHGSTGDSMIREADILAWCPINPPVEEPHP